MTLEDFVKQLKEDVEAFGPHIEDLNRKYPEGKAENLEDVDWYEQFAMFLDNR